MRTALARAAVRRSILSGCCMRSMANMLRSARRSCPMPIFRRAVGKAQLPHMANTGASNIGPHLVRGRN